ncbi:hypothetical protein BESB_015990 [Besnoitia besnoiti]|uniref:Uncharacterized protein n=1 Tax=Besnoitia besnoiti TaxID=94643 RepID=A0A2A9M7K4_BESBE|nr:hypothetical protein BESB_015990 [Besnoitia besnoiti]PFH32281.1 hypothetical protein BESB_015990 [Besnoitia besnoiti]
MSMEDPELAAAARRRTSAGDTRPAEETHPLKPVALLKPVEGRNLPECGDRESCRPSLERGDPEETAPARRTESDEEECETTAAVTRTEAASTLLAVSGRELSEGEESEPDDRGEMCQHGGAGTIRGLEAPEARSPSADSQAEESEGDGERALRGDTDEQPSASRNEGLSSRVPASPPFVFADDGQGEDEEDSDGDYFEDEVCSYFRRDRRPFLGTLATLPEGREEEECSGADESEETPLEGGDSGDEECSGAEEEKPVEGGERGEGTRGGGEGSSPHALEDEGDAPRPEFLPSASDEEERGAEGESNESEATDAAEKAAESEEDDGEWGDGLSEGVPEVEETLSEGDGAPLEATASPEAVFASSSPPAHSREAGGADVSGSGLAPSPRWQPACWAASSSGGDSQGAEARWTPTTEMFIPRATLSQIAAYQEAIQRRRSSGLEIPARREKAQPVLWPTLHSVQKANGEVARVTIMPSPLSLYYFDQLCPGTSHRRALAAEEECERRRSSARVLNDFLEASEALTTALCTDGGLSAYVRTKQAIEAHSCWSGAGREVKRAHEPAWTAQPSRGLAAAPAASSSRSCVAQPREEKRREPSAASLTLPQGGGRSCVAGGALSHQFSAGGTLTTGAAAAASCARFSSSLKLPDASPERAEDLDSGRSLPAAMHAHRAQCRLAADATPHDEKKGSHEALEVAQGCGEVPLDAAAAWRDAGGVEGFRETRARELRARERDGDAALLFAGELGRTASEQLFAESLRPHLDVSYAENTLQAAVLYVAEKSESRPLACVRAPASMFLSRGAVGGRERKCCF